MTPEERKIHDAALAYARKHKKAIAKRLTDPRIYPLEKIPVSVFMAGSPGAGKTEASIELIELLSDDGRKILRIDPDELRDEFPGYDGQNSWLFHAAVSIIVERIHDLLRIMMAVTDSTRRESIGLTTTYPKNMIMSPCGICSV